MAKRKSAGRAKKTSVKKPPAVRKKVPANRVARTAAPGNAPTTARIQENNRERRAIERAIDQERDKKLTAYRTQFRAFAARREGAPKTILAEGDSWFNYPLGSAVIDQLQNLIHTPIANFAWPGAETRQLLALHERKEIEKRFSDGPAKGKKWDVLLFSGGGDDIVGDQMVLFLTRGAYDSEHPERVLNGRFEEVLDLVMGAYQDLVNLRDQLSPNTLIVSHVYDYAWATNKGVCWLGPWLQPSLNYALVPKGDDQHKVIIAMLDRFEARLQKVANGAKNFLIVPTHGTLKTANEWANELHPKDPGFHRIAERFQTVLQERLGRDI